LNPSSVRLPRLAIIGAVVVLAATFHLFVGPAAQPPVAPASTRHSGVTNLDEMPDEALSDRALHLVAQARRFASRGRFADADAKLDEADKVAPGLGEIAEARRKIAQLATPEGQFALRIGRARTAVGNAEYSAAEKELAAAARLKPDAPEIAGLRREMEAMRQREAKRSNQVAELLAAMRRAIAGKDIAGADRAFNAAARIDVLDPALDQARTELAQAHEAAR
jgi:hypothetical protein